MKILLYNPDNGVTRNFMPHLWMFLLQALTPAGHDVVLIDGNSRPMDDEEIVRFVRDQEIGLVGIGAMTRMIAKAYRVAAAIRATGVPVVMGGPHVTALPEEALGRTGGPRYADAVAVGEADQTWPEIIADAELRRLREVYSQLGAENQPEKPDLQPYPAIPWEKMDLAEFNLVPRFLRPIFQRLGDDWGRFRIFPIETGRGCPYGCEFCTVTGFFGSSIRFRSNESVVDEMLRIKSRVRDEGGQAAIFFVDDNLAINVKRAKSLLRDIIAADARMFWIGQISINLLRDEELIDLIAASGGMWLFVGLESIDMDNLTKANKGHNKPDQFGPILTRLAERNIFAITSFIFGMDNDQPGVAAKTLHGISDWPPGLPVFGQLTPYPGTPLYDRLEAAGRLSRPRHWLEFTPFEMAHEPLRISSEQVRDEIRQAWTGSYSPERNTEVLDVLGDRHVGYRIMHLITRIFFRGIYFTQMSRRDWLRVIHHNRHGINRLIRELVVGLRPGAHGSSTAAGTDIGPRRIPDASSPGQTQSSAFQRDLGRE